MKKFHKAFLTVIATLSLLSLTACNDVIFDEVRKEVKLEKAQISGDSTSIIRFTKGGEEYLFVQNGNIYRKTITGDKNLIEHNWTKTSKPSSSAKYNYICKLAADQTYLYAQLTKIVEDTDEGENIGAGCEVWCSDDLGETWKPVKFGTETHFNKGIIFCTNDVTSSNREAYARITGTEGNKLYKLSGESSADIGVATETERDYAKAYTDSKSCAKFNGTTYFSTGAMNINAAGDLLFRSSGKSVYFSADGTNWEHYDYSSTINSIALTKDYMVLGTDDGIAHVMLDENNKPKSTESGFSNNAASALSSYYIVKTVFAVDPSANEYEGVLYGTITYEGSSGGTSATQDNCGLWAYYPDRKTWNRE